MYICSKFKWKNSFGVRVEELGEGQEPFVHDLDAFGACSVGNIVMKLCDLGIFKLQQVRFIVFTNDFIQTLANGQVHHNWKGLRDKETNLPTCARLLHEYVHIGCELLHHHQRFAVDLELSVEPFIPLFFKFLVLLTSENELIK